MKSYINNCNIYFVIILLCGLNGTLYAPGGIVSQVLQTILILMSLYYTFYANIHFKLPVYFRALNIMLIMFTIYGLLFLISGEQLRVDYMSVSRIEYLKSIYKSLLPIYAFYVFGKKNLLTEKTLKFWFFVFFALVIQSFFINQDRLLQAAYERGSSEEEFTNNISYSFVGLLPAIVLFHKKPIIQYVCLAVCGYFIILGMKRGAILCGAVCLLWFLFSNMKEAPQKRKWLYVFISIVVVLLGIYYFNYMMENSSYFQYRINQTEAGESSGRDDLYEMFFTHFVNESNPFRALFGYGANGTLKISNNFAHNDWLEIAINQGLIGLIIFLVYWICLFVSWKQTKSHPQAFMAIGMFLIIYYLETLFSMSYNNVSKCSAMVLGYYLATWDHSIENPTIP